MSAFVHGSVPSRDREGAACGGPAALALGLRPGERAIIIHADDVGMCHATIPAFIELAEMGNISSASVMVPCPWFPEVARYCRAHPAIDMGVHLTLTSEWPGYRWSPLTGPDCGLADAAGYFHARRGDVVQRANPKTVDSEMLAQLARARDAGIDVTHLDAHMFTALQPSLIAQYLRLGREEKLPCFVPRTRMAGGPLQPETEAIVRSEESNGLLSLDAVASLPPGVPERRDEQFRAVLDRLRPGLTHFLIHPAVDTPELRHIATSWADRVADYQYFRGEKVQRHLREAGVRLAGYRSLRDALRNYQTTVAECESR